MTESELPTPINYEELLSANKTVIVAFSGAFSGGKNIGRFKSETSKTFGKNNVVVYDSISTSQSFLHTGGELTLGTYINNQYYENLARHFAESHQDCKRIILHMESGGGVEGVAFLQRLLARNDFSDKKVDLLLTGIPGLAEKSARAIPRLWEFGKSFIEMAAIRTNLDLQDDIYPLPDRCYGLPAKLTGQRKPEEVAYEENDTSREERRQRFLNQYFEKYSPEEQQKIKSRFQNFDQEIIRLMDGGAKFDSERIQQLIQKRARLVVQVDNHRLKKTKVEKPSWFNDKLICPVISLIYISRICESVARGMEKDLAGVINVATGKNVSVNFAIGLFERDPIIEYKDVGRIEERLKDVIDNFTSWLLIQGLSHQSVDNTPEGIIGAIKKILDFK